MLGEAVSACNPAVGSRRYEEWRCSTMSARSGWGGRCCRARRFRRSSRAARRSRRPSAMARVIMRWRAASRRRSSTAANASASGSECIWTSPVLRPQRWATAAGIHALIHGHFRAARSWPVAQRDSLSYDRLLPACVHQAVRSHREVERSRDAGKYLLRRPVERDCSRRAAPPRPVALSAVASVKCPPEHAAKCQCRAEE